MRKTRGVSLIPGTKTCQVFKTWQVCLSAHISSEVVNFHRNHPNSPKISFM